MAGRERKYPAMCVRRLRGAPVGFSSSSAARKAHRDALRSAAILRALVAAHGESVEITWNYPGTWATPDGGEPIARQAILSWERRGWVRHVLTGDVRRSLLAVDLDALPDSA